MVQRRQGLGLHHAAPGEQGGCLCAPGSYVLALTPISPLLLISNWKPGGWGNKSPSSLTTTANGRSRFGRPFDGGGEVGENWMQWHRNLLSFTVNTVWVTNRENYLSSCLCRIVLCVWEIYGTYFKHFFKTIYSVRYFRRWFCRGLSRFFVMYIRFGFDHSADSTNCPVLSLFLPFPPSSFIFCICLCARQMWETDGSRADWTPEAKSEPQMNFYIFWGEKEGSWNLIHTPPPVFRGRWVFRRYGHYVSVSPKKWFGSFSHVLTCCSKHTFSLFMCG